MRLTAVVPATNHPATLARCRSAIESAAMPPDEVLVITDPSGAGPAAARNAGAEAASGDVLVFVDADVVVHPDAFLRIRERLADGRLAGVFGSYDDEPEADSVVSRFRNLLHHHVHQEAAGPVASFWAGLGALRRDAFAGVGGFDAERFPSPSIEDVELGVRLHAAGYEVELDPGLLGTHLKRWSLVEMLRTDALARAAPWAELALRRRALPAELNLGRRHRLSAAAALAVAVATVRRRPLAAVAAAATLVGANRRFYALLVRKLGVTGATLGAGLHVLHHLAAIAALPVGAGRFLRERRRARRR